MKCMLFFAEKKKCGNGLNGLSSLDETVLYTALSKGGLRIGIIEILSFIIFSQEHLEVSNLKYFEIFQI